MADMMLQDRRVLVVEDEYLIAEAVSRGLRRAGAIVLGPVANVDAALALLDREEAIDAAVLDINLGEQRVYPVVDRLLARGTRCVFATGNDPADVPPAYAAVTRCEKPVDTGSLVQALADNPDRRAAGKVVAADPLVALRDQLHRQIEVAERAGKTLLAAKLGEALDVATDLLDDRS